MEVGSFFEAFAAAVGHGSRRLLQNQAVGRRGEIDAASEGLPGEHEEVGIVVVAAK